ncbi:MAG: hypothetical protein HY235_27030 [Acidobacteria bacterium]|nr:hypothetical protein [Acidobacteriota bacterium]
MKRALLVVCCAPCGLWAQEAGSGFELGATLSGTASYSERLTARPRSGAPVTGGVRSLLYPTWKLNQHWGASRV